ncbi:spindle pole body formation-associated protein-domain-containing protein [Halenospora varia]|nr:spindle pole body formation-associated protein-domain-containing protein [Halenospora varia]
MLNWWLGRGGEESRVPGEGLDVEPPETPAPVFAARALKSALFGTPAQLADDTMCETEDQEEVVANTERNLTAKLRQLRDLSPSKPPGILLTPGTAATRRKTVSFDKEVANDDSFGEAVPRGLQAPDKEDTDNPETKWRTKRDAPARLSRKTSLTDKLERVRGEKAGVAKPTWQDTDQDDCIVLDPTAKSKSSKPSQPQSEETEISSGNRKVLQEFVPRSNSEVDMTVDLDQPHSRSGQYWKAQWQTYHDEAQAEMQRLLKYKHHAKTYAKKKDATATELAEKLKEAQRKVVIMENMVSGLSARVAAIGVEDKDDESPELMKELARQTALALEYKAQVEEFRKTLEGGEATTSNVHTKKNPISPRSEQTLLDTHHELKKAREQLREKTELRSELHDLRQKFAATEKSSRKLEEENTNLNRELLHLNARLERQSERYDKLKESSDEQIQRKDDALKKLQKDYDDMKNTAKRNRRDAELLLKEKHDRATRLRNEIKSLRAKEAKMQELHQGSEKRTSELEKMLAKREEEIPSLISRLGLNHGTAEGKGEQNLNALLAVDAPQSRESLIPAPVQFLPKPSKTVSSLRRARSETPIESPVPRPTQALSEIVNNASFDTVPPKSFGPVQYTPMVKQFYDLSLNSPQLDLPSDEPSLPLAPRAHTSQASPRPSMFNIASSPPKPVVLRSRASAELPRRKSGNEVNEKQPKNIVSSRLSSMDGSRVRTFIPPERAAAARARLEQKNAEKKRVQAMGREKENIPN